MPPPPKPAVGELRLPKNRSTGNLLSQAATARDRAHVRFSFDAGPTADQEALSRSPVITEHEHGLGASGLRRIRQQPPRTSFDDSTDRPPARAASMILSLPSRHGSMALPGPASPTLAFGEDLYRFPSESLHSFSFAHQSEESIHSRQNILKRSVDFMRERLGWAGSNPAIATARAKIAGDPDHQGMVDLLARADLTGIPGGQAQGLGLQQGPLTGPAELNADNMFEKTFVPRSQSPDDLDPSTPTRARAEGADGSVGAEPGTGDGHARESDGARKDTSDTATATSSLPPSPDPTSRTTTNESRSTAKTSPPGTRRSSLKRTYTDVSPLSLQTKLMEALAQPYVQGERPSGGQQTHAPPMVPGTSLPTLSWPNPHSASVHGHASRWAPAAQAIFTTESCSPWTILAANDLACLVFGVTKAEVRKIGILEVVREERRSWLEEKLRSPGPESPAKARSPYSQSQRGSPTATSSPWAGNGVTARLLSKPSWRDRRSQTDDGSGSSIGKKKAGKASANHTSSKSRGVLLCGDVVPIQKRNGVLGSASLWVKEKRGGLIWVLEEITEDVAFVHLDGGARVTEVTGSSAAIWGDAAIEPGADVGRLLPCLPRKDGLPDYAAIEELRHFAALTADGVSIPATVGRVPGQAQLSVSSFPHIAGMMVLSASHLEITSSNSVFSAALFGQSRPDGLSITDLIPGFDKLLRILTEEDKVQLVDGIVVPEHSFRRARAILSLREGRADAVSGFLRPTGLPATHRDGSEIKVDVQMRVVKSDSFVPDLDENVIEETEEDEAGLKGGLALTELVYALWITYSRNLHAVLKDDGVLSPLLSRPSTPHQPSPGQTQGGRPPDGLRMGSGLPTPLPTPLAEQVQPAPAQSIASAADRVRAEENGVASNEAARKKTIGDFVVLEEMGQGAYGQVKLVRYKRNMAQKMVLKYVTKRRILVDTWTRDRRLGTVPLEIHVLDYLRRDGLRHANIVEMSDFFEDDVNYYIEMVPHGLPGMDLFDYIELRVNMEEAECRSIFRQVAEAIYHLHTKALVVHRDIKDENVVLDGDGNVKLIDFGSAAYIKNGPFDVFVGTIDYAAPEVLAGRSYRGKEQDVWALGILLYTIVYKENPFYSIDEIMDHDLRVPYVMSEDSIDLIRLMLDRDVDRRISIPQVLEHAWIGGDARAQGDEGA
ncbi:MAG: hypothetical protein M1832_000924 [Thelocarpon impressellum]|nr:MAG: hypothetical protein M1832_000924 [Thelocarpon impressellum]